MTATLAKPPLPAFSPPAPPRRPAQPTAPSGMPSNRPELRKFTAATMAECLNLVKTELGPGAVILSTRNVTTKKLFGLIRQEHVEITAGRGLRPNQRRRPTLPSRPVAQAREAAPISYNANGKPGSSLMETGAAASAAYLGVTQEVGDLKKVVASLVEQVQNQKTPDLPETLAPHYRRLTDQQASDAVAREITNAVRESLSREELADASVVGRAVESEVAKRLPVSGPTKRRVKGKPHVVAFIGPTGVGKTTTTAKLAATLKLKGKCRVALITIDTYRIAAIDQLKKYAEIIDAPLTVVNQPADIKDAVARLADHDYILIDTAGRSPRDATKLSELGQFLDAAAPDETHLVLSTVCGKRAIKLAMERFAGIRADRLIFTKLDEAADLGAMLDVAATSKLPLSYTTAGQDVPDDITVAEPAALAKAILRD